MFSKLILCASPNRLVVGRWRWGKFSGCEVFHADSEGREAFRHYLQGQSNTPVYLIVNVAEEDYRTETVPHAVGRARNELLARKLGQIYRTSQYRTAMFLEREQDQRKDDQFLFMALNNADNVTPWVGILEEQRLLLGGIYLLPVLTQQLLVTWKIKAPDVLLISRQNFGVRQTYFRNGKLRLSRLTRIPGIDTMAADQLAELFFSEAQKTRAYLSSQRLIKPGADLQLVAYNASEETCSHLVAEKRSFACTAISAAEISRQLGVQLPLMQKCPELAHMTALAHHVPAASLALASQTRAYFLRQWRWFIHFSSAAVLLGAAGLSFFYWLQAADHDHQRELAMRQTAKQMASYEEVAKNFPKAPLAADELRKAVETAQKLAESAKTPKRLMLVVGAVLGGMPEVQLNGLRWKLTDDPNVKDDEKDPQPPVPVASMPAALLPQLGSNAGKLMEVGFVAGEIKNFRGDYREAVEIAARLVEQLKKNKEVDQVVVVSQPINASSLTSLQGSTQDGQAQQSAKALFKLKMVLKREGGT